MSLGDAERVFGKSAKYIRDDDTAYDKERLRRNLRGLLIDHRVMADAGLDIAVANDPRGTVARLRVNPANRVALDCPAAHAPLREVMPVCDRWPDVNANSYTFNSQRTAVCDVLGAESRPTLPTATLAAGEGLRVGPGGTMRADLESTWDPIQTLGDIITEAEATAGEIPSDCNAPDPTAFLQDGFRVWPPRALATYESAERAAALVSQTCDTIEAVDQRMRLSNGPAVFVKAWSATLGDSLLTDVGKRNAIGLGVVLFTRDPMALHTARRTAFHTSMASYARGCLHLGKQLERLGDLILTLKR